MTFSPRLLALDVDGTLVDADDVMTEAVREAITDARAAGLHVVISTGRSVPGVLDAARLAGLEDEYAVASNGSVVFTYDPVDILHTVTFDATVAVETVLEHVPEAAVAVEEIGVGYRINKAFPDGEINGRMTVQPVADLVATPVTRVIIRSPESSPEDFHALGEELGLRDVSYFVGYTAWLDLAPPGVSKASGLDVVCERLDVRRDEVLAIGDGYNDVEMLRWAGLGVAMGQAPDEVKDAADEVTGPIEADGAAATIRAYLP